MSQRALIETGKVYASLELAAENWLNMYSIFRQEGVGHSEIDQINCIWII